MKDLTRLVQLVRLWKTLALSTAAFCIAGMASAQITVPGANGSDGVLNITTNMVIDLSQAQTAAWDTSPATAGTGVYDSNQWAVVFKYLSVNIATNATLTFANHPSRAPVVWLVSGNVTIDGTLSLDGQVYAPVPLLAEPGPGGFRGGTGNFAVGARGASGFGPGGGLFESSIGRGGKYDYGNPSLIPLIGGSGGAGDAQFDANGGGGGGGACLIAATGSVTINGALTCNGGAGRNQSSRNSGGGSGGGCRIVANAIGGSGSVSALGGFGWETGGPGKIRLERVADSSSFASIIPPPSVVPLQANDQALLWPPASAPEVTVLSVDQVAVPADPRATFDAQGSDVVLPLTNAVRVVVQTINVEQASEVSVRNTPRINANARTVNATVDQVVNQAPLTIRWVADVPVEPGYSAIQVRVVRP